MNRRLFLYFDALWREVCPSPLRLAAPKYSPQLRLVTVAATL